METIYFLGIDIAKKTFQSALTLDGISMVEMEVENSSKAIRAYFQDLKKKFNFCPQQVIVCLEHTGIYSYPLLDYLVKRGVKVCVESALQIKQSQGMRRGKSDKVDARRIAQYVYKNHRELRFWQPQRTVIQKIKALLTVRERLVKTRAQLMTPLNESESYMVESTRKTIIEICHRSVNALKKDISKVEEQIEAILHQDAQLGQQVKWATSVPGVGKITALNVIVVTDEFKRISDGKKFACYAGVAPFEHTSGSSIKGKTRVSKMANMTLKKLLTLGAMSAINCCDELRSYYDRKVEGGKNRMSVLNAVRNKLISRIFACVKNERPYQKVYQHALV